MPSEQASDSGKRGQAVKSKKISETVLIRLGFLNFCFSFAGFMKLFQRLIAFSAWLCFAVAVSFKDD